MTLEVPTNVRGFKKCLKNSMLTIISKTKFHLPNEEEKETVLKTTNCVLKKCYA